MGGYGSGRWRRGRPVVESCLTITPKKVPPGCGNLRWSCGGRPAGSVHYETECIEDYSGRITDVVAVTLTYTTTGDDPRTITERIPLTSTPLPSGGRRWWFVCRFNVQERQGGELRIISGGCGNLAGKIYLPPGGRHFACRKCWRLAYTSAQEARNPNTNPFMRELAGAMGCSPRDIQREFNREDRENQRKTNGEKLADNRQTTANAINQHESPRSPL